MVEPLYWKSKVILFKMEGSYGVDPSPTGAANAMLMTGVKLSPMEGSDVSRDLDLPYLSAQGKIPVGLRVRLQGNIELQGSGVAGTAPGWGPMLRACGIAETIAPGTSVTYTPVSSGMESGTLWFWIGATLQKVVGMRGTVTMKFSAQGLPYLSFDMTGLFSAPVTLAQATPTLSAFEKPSVVTNTATPTFTVNGVSLVMREFTLAINNQVVPRLLVGSEQIIIPSRAESISTQVEAVPPATLDPFALAQTQTSIGVALVHGTVAGKIISLNCPTCEIGRLGDYTNQDNVVEWVLPITPLPSTGNDQWSLALT